MDNFDIPIFKKTYELYKTFYSFRNLVPKQDRYSIWLKSESTILEILEALIIASQLAKTEKSLPLDKASLKLSCLRVFTRLMKDTKVIDKKKYITIETMVDEIGRMLGGWIKSVK